MKSIPTKPSLPYRSLPPLIVGESQEVMMMKMVSVMMVGLRDDRDREHDHDYHYGDVL